MYEIRHAIAWASCLLVIIELRPILSHRFCHKEKKFILLNIYTHKQIHTHQADIQTHNFLIKLLMAYDLCFFLVSYSLFFFPFIFISWRLITSQHCSGFCHTLTWISHGVTCIPHPDPPSLFFLRTAFYLFIF